MLPFRRKLPLRDRGARRLGGEGRALKHNWAFCHSTRSDGPLQDQRASICASAVSVWGSQKVMSMDSVHRDRRR